MMSNIHVIPPRARLKDYTVEYILEFDGAPPIVGTLPLQAYNTPQAVSMATRHTDELVVSTLPQGRLKKYRLSVEKVSA